MIKIIIRTFQLLLILILISIIYLSTIGIKTDQFNNKIVNKVKGINKNLNLELKNVNLLLNLFQLKINIKTLGTNLRFMDKTIELESLESSILLRSIVKDDFLLSGLQISTKSIRVKNLISFIKIFKKDVKLFVAEQLIKDGYIIADIGIEFDKNGKIKENYKAKGFIKDGKINLFKKYILTDLNFNFELSNDTFNFEEVDLKVNKIEILIPQLTVKKKIDKFLVSGQIDNRETILDKDMVNLIDLDFLDLNIKKAKFSSKNLFNFEISKDFDFKNLEIKSNIDLKSLILPNKFDLSNFFLKANNELIFQNHKITLDYDKDNLKIKGAGDLVLNDNQEKIQYDILKDKKKINFDIDLSIFKNELKLNFLNYEKKKNLI